MTKKETLYIGIDIGSTTTKLVLMDPKSEEILYSDYRRHGARQIESVKLYLEELRERLSDKDIHIAMTGSGAKDLSDALGLSYVQEVVANSIAIRKLYGEVSTAIELMMKVPYDRKKERPKVLIVGEYLLNFHPGANHDIEEYLERNGFEIIEAHMTDVIRKTYFTKDTQIREYKLDQPLSKKGYYGLTDSVFELAHDVTDRIAKAHPLYEPPMRLPELVKDSDQIIQHTFDTGEGVLIPAEVIHYAKKGCRAFVILQPFGCLPNHIVGRGIMKRLKELYPDSQILALDYDPDVSFANVENRLQMLIMNAKAKEVKKAVV